ncbi:hypothetical protein H6P81_018887 [Aristolochia fimbriata]|uniref:Uncharacterized protein n=1 Tax=Aristolochia fimbriata TaxID=158543 RepID=A0AAV7E2J3_ARIFI|nr:hypothetical protein H6P81_018887 [Aristolochia fimbriata]
MAGSAEWRLALSGAIICLLLRNGKRRLSRLRSSRDRRYATGFCRWTPTSGASQEICDSVAPFKLKGLSTEWRGSHATRVDKNARLKNKLNQTFLKITKLDKTEGDKREKIIRERQGSPELEPGSAAHIVGTHSESRGAKHIGPLWAAPRDSLRTHCHPYLGRGKGRGEVTVGGGGGRRVGPGEVVEWGAGEVTEWGRGRSSSGARGGRRVGPGEVTEGRAVIDRVTIPWVARGAADREVIGGGIGIGGVEQEEEGLPTRADSCLETDERSGLGTFIDKENALGQCGMYTLKGAGLRNKAGGGSGGFKVDRLIRRRSH